MASHLVAARGDSAPLPASDRSLVDLCVSRRVPLSIALFTGLIVIDLVVLRTRPRDFLSLDDPLAAVSLIVIFAGLAVRSWAAGTLRKQQQLATTGPYAFVRHPLYFGSFLMMVGFGTLVQDPITLWAVAGPVAWLYWQAIKSEERKVATLFPHEWTGYARRVPRLIPYRPATISLQDWSLAQWRRNSEHRAWLGAAVALVAIKIWQLLA
jgi:protein-S-isoprenylcysteine O-methyltransferase Ste14